MLDAIAHLYGEDALDRAMAESLERMRGTQTPEARAEAAARKAIADAKKAEQDAAEQAQKEREEAARKEVQARIEKSDAALRAAAAALPAGEMRAIQAYGLQPVHTLKHWADTHNGELPTEAQLPEAIRAHEAALRAQLKASGFDIPAPPPEPAPAPAPAAEPQEKARPTVRSKASTITSDDAGEVPLRRAPKSKETAIERTERLIRERGWGQPSN